MSRANQATDDSAHEGPQLEDSTARGATGIFRRFVLVVVGVTMLTGSTMLAYDIADSIAATGDSLESRGELAVNVWEQLRRSEPTLSPQDRTARTAQLTGLPIALLSAEGRPIFSTDPAIPRRLPQVFADGVRPGIHVEIRDELGHLSGGWLVHPQDDGRKLLVVVRRLPEEEGILRYATIGAGVLALGLLVSVVALLLSANWMLRLPLGQLVSKLTSALARDVARRRLAEHKAVEAQHDAEQHLKKLQLNELQLIQTAKLASLGEMATGVAHELNQPLNNIGLLTLRLSRRVGLGRADSEFLTEKLDKIHGQVERAGKIINHLRTFGRPSATAVTQVELREPIDNVLGLLGEQFTRRGIHLEVELPDDLPLVKADESQLEQVLVNLLNNALAAHLETTKDRPWVRITVDTQEHANGSEEVCLEVSDNGSGMSESVSQRVFEPFFSTKDVGQGTGLGLSISYGLVQGFGGRLEVCSTLGRGTTFTVFLEAQERRHEERGES